MNGPLPTAPACHNGRSKTVIYSMGEAWAEQGASQGQRVASQPPSRQTAGWRQELMAGQATTVDC
eukprot:358695-Chlamydomonas_euryale.AAC.6